MSAAVRTWRWMRVCYGIAAIVPLLIVLAILRQHGRASSADLSPLETRVLGQSRWLNGGPAALRVITTDHRTGKPVRATVQMRLVPLQNGKPGKQSYHLYAGKTTALGTVEATFDAPDVKPGAYQLQVDVESNIGQDAVVQPIQLEESLQVMLTADKPLYQPGQTMHLRALALDLATRAAVGGKTLVFEIEDARGNKVFKKKVKLSEFGIAATDFTLADEVNMGNFTLRATLPEGTTEKKVRVERYVLPKYKLALTTDKAYYLPGETVKGTVQADYFFGKPVAKGEATVEVETLSIGVTKLAELKGTTDANGTYKFEYTLPDHFVGQSFEQGKATFDFHLTLVDTADHLQEADTMVPVVKDPITLAIIPETRQLQRGLENRVFIAAATPDGQPLKGATLKVGLQTPGGWIEQATLTTDEMGLATYTFTPKDRRVVVVKAFTKEGRTAQETQTLDMAPSQEGILLRSSKSLVKVGDRITVAAISTIPRGTIYLDIIRNKQTILTRALETENGQAAMTLNITHDMEGTIALHAYKILPNEEIIRDTQTMVVMPANDLTISVEKDKAQYRPGEEATLTFTVKDQRNHPILAALGVAIVDESVFALSELQPGLEKIYFTLEKELMEPKYEIHGMTPVDLVLPAQPLDDNSPVRPVLKEAQRQQVAEVLFAAVPGQGDFDFRVNTYQQRWEKLKVLVTAEMSKEVETMRKAVQAYRQKTGTALTAEQSLFHLVENGYLKLRDLQDRWGNFYTTNLYGNSTYDGWFSLSSPGPDGRWGTGDDLRDVGGIQVNWQMDAFDGAVADDRVGFKALGRFEMPKEARARMGMPMGGVAVFSTAVPPAKPMPTSTAAPAEEPVRIRQYFPETMYWNPAIITGPDGRAEVKIPLADSITTWRMSVLANSMRGQLGSTTAVLKVFQDFFVDIDLPVALTANDRVEIPVAVYNYLPQAQQVTLNLEMEPWFLLEGPDQQVLEIGPDQVKVVYFPIIVNKIGHHALTVQAKGTKLADAIRREIDVLPDGKEFRPTINGRLDGNVAKTVTIPTDAIDGASTVWVKLYPGAFSQVVEGLDSLLRMPNGCFEQTSSTTYPNIMVLSYLKQTKKIKPELQMKAEQYINVGYQRLVTFECKNGGFSWFGDEPAHQILTAYGLLEFSDMSKVHDVDPAIIQRTQQWLAGRQQADGSWASQEGGIAEGIINRQTGALRSTAYIAWTLAESGYQGGQVNKAVQYVKAHRGEAKDPYTLAVMLNLLTKVEKDGAVTGAVAQQLVELAKVDDKTAYWVSDTQTFTGAQAHGADLETTGMAAYALVKWGRANTFLNKVLTHIIQSKDSFGTWESTQGTVWSLKALLYASSNAFGGGKGTVKVLANGKEAATFHITPEDSDVMRQVDLAGHLTEGANNVVLQYTGEGSLLYQIVGRYYLPWTKVEQLPAAKAPLKITVAYDKTTLAQDDTATVTVTITNTSSPRAVVEMPLIDVGVPPGFTPLTESLDAAVAKRTISKYTVAARQIIIYLEKLAPGQTVTLTYGLKAKYPIRARTPQSQAYPYYNPEKADISAPQRLVVEK